MLFLLVVLDISAIHNTQGCEFHAIMVTLFPQQVIVTAMDSIYTLVYKQIIINAKLQIGKRGQNIDLTERSPLRK
jgi:hypothetical protein